MLRVLAEITDEMNSVFFLRFCPCNWGTRKREDTAPKASVCFLGGAQKIFDGVSEDLLGGTGKAEDAKLLGAGIIPKLCPMERVGMERMDRTGSHRCELATYRELREWLVPRRMMRRHREALPVVCKESAPNAHCLPDMQIATVLRPDGYYLCGEIWFSH